MGTSEKNDSRSIDFVDEFLSGGKLYGFRKIIEKAKTQGNHLELCFRGNSGNVVIIYYNNHILFKIYKTKDDFILELSFNHARYTKGWKIEQSKLEKLGFRKYSNKNKIMKFQTNGLYEDEFITKVYDVMMLIMKDYFCALKQIDEFRKSDNLEQTNRKKPSYIEKIRQQELMRILNDTKNGYFVYDLEFEQPHKNIEERKKDLFVNKPDMLAIKFKDGEPEKLTFIEVKSKKKSCYGKCGLDDHGVDMKEYIKQSENLYARKKEACEIINDYAKLGLRGLDSEVRFEQSQFDNIDVEILFVFTDEAISFYNKHKEKYRSKEEITFAIYDAELTELLIK